MIILDGKSTAQSMKDKLKSIIETTALKNGKPRLMIIQVGSDSASEIYVRNKRKACDEVGIECSLIKCLPDISQKALNQLIKLYSDSPVTRGIILQLPLPKHLNSDEALTYLDPAKDVDGLTLINQGKLFTDDESAILPCTPSGIVKLLKHYNIGLEGMNAVVIGRSRLLGKPLAQLLLKENCTVTTCHSKTKNLKQITKNADLVICAVGKENLLTADMVKDNVIVVDAGMNRDKDGKLCGDVDFENVSRKCSYITPVPGGVGPMTVSMLLWNTLHVALKMLKS